MKGRVRSTLGSFLLLGSLGLATLASAIELVPSNSALASDGTLYRLQASSFGSLFGEHPAFPPDRPILVLDVLRPGQALERWLVPGTEGVEVEGHPTLLYEESTQTAYLVWSSLSSGNFPGTRLWLRSFGPQGWGAAVDLSSGSTAPKRALRVALTGDDYQAPVGGSPRRFSRRVLHLVWVEDTAAGPTVFYAPVLFVDGHYVGWNPVVALDSVVTATDPSNPPASAALSDAVHLELADTRDRVAVGFVDPQTRRLASVVVRVLPAELGRIADEARGHIIELLLANPSLGPGEIGDAARGHIIELSLGVLHPAVSQYVAGGVQSALASLPAGLTPEQVGEVAERQVLALGNQVGASGLAAGGGGLVLEVPPLVPAPGRDFAHFLLVQEVRTWNAPEVTSSSPFLLVSEDGRRALVGWFDGSRIFYRETLPQGGFWGELKSFDLGQTPFAEVASALVARLSMP